MKKPMRQYRDLPLDFADAALVRVAERERLTRILPSTERLTRILTFDKAFRVLSPSAPGTIHRPAPGAVEAAQSNPPAARPFAASTGLYCEANG